MNGHSALAGDVILLSELMVRRVVWQTFCFASMNWYAVERTCFGRSRCIVLARSNPGFSVIVAVAIRDQHVCMPTGTVILWLAAGRHTKASDFSPIIHRYRIRQLQT